MTELLALTKRNTKLFFKDKGMFFTALITPMILLVLYATFLSNVYHDSFMSSIPEGVKIEEKLIDAVVGGQLVSSLLAVCCVTVSFCSNMLMVQDKITGARRDLTITPVKRSTMALSYYIATSISTLLICFIAMGAGLLYISQSGWYLSGSDIMFMILDVFLLTMFGTALSSIINYFLSSQGQSSAVGSIVSAGYGFICGAYMPISQFGEGLQKALMFLPGTYGTCLIRNHTMRGAFEEMKAQNFPTEIITAMQNSIDYNLYFFGDKVQIGAMYAVVGISVAVLIAAYILINMLIKKQS